MSYYLVSQLIDVFRHLIPCVVAGSIVHYLLLCTFFHSRNKIYNTYIFCAINMTALKYYDLFVYIYVSVEHRS
jgi:hypothetical protein